MVLFGLSNILYFEKVNLLFSMNCGGPVTFSFGIYIVQNIEKFGYV